MRIREEAAILAATGLAWVMVAGAAEPELPAFRAYEQPTYTLVTHDEHAARQLPGQIVRIDEFLAQLMASEVQAPNSPTIILVVPRALWRNYLEPREYATSEFVPARFANYVLIQEDVNSFRLRSALFHEYTHVFLRSRLRRYYPVWFDEGMATLVEHSKFEDRRVQVGSQLRYDGSWIPLSRLLRLDRSSPEYLSENQSKSVHFGAWSLVHRAFVKDAEFGKQLLDFMGALHNLTPIDTALQKSFGVNADELDLRMRRYARQVVGTSVIEIRIPPVPAAALPPGRDLAPAESLVLLAEVMLASGFKPERLAEVIDAAQRAAPDSPEALALRMRLAVRGGDDAMLLRLLAGLEPRLADTRVARAAGLALFERVRAPGSDDPLAASERERLGRRAHELLGRAVAGKPDDVEAIWGYTTLAARYKQDLPAAIDHLNRALGVASYNADLAQAVAQVFEAQGNTKQMIPFLVLTARMTRVPEQREWAIERVNAMLASQATAELK